jgi:hypothetical protein
MVGFQPMRYAQKKPPAFQQVAFLLMGEWWGDLVRK